MFWKLFDSVCPITVDDITLVVCLRAHENNEWVIQRLNRLASYYDPMPRVLIVDFGSKGVFKRKIGKICKSSGFNLLHVKNYDTYSASAAHNAALNRVETEFIFFKDIDFLGERDLFSRAAKAANAANMRVVFDTVLDVPAYHVSKEKSEIIDQCANPDDIDIALARVGFSGQTSAFGSDVEFVAPYSNIFLINKNFFSMSGGYSESFVGHGSEDFEYFMRLAAYSSYFRTPADIETDCHGPTKWDFWRPRPYRGFRAINQLIAGRAERAGLKIFHIWHPTGGDGDWRKENDWRRERLRAVYSTYAKEPSNLLSVDALKREKTAVCICKSADHWGYFLPLRIHGYTIVPIFSDTMKDLDKVNQLLDEGSVDALAIFNPYMKSHDKFRALFMRAKDEGVKTIVIERGALPNSIYYADDVAYASKQFKSETLDDVLLTDEEIGAARQYIQNIRTGDYLLEGAASREFSDRKYWAVSKMKRKRVFIPLQLSDDMAVTKYVRTSQSYADFAASIPCTARDNPDILFLVKPHPLSKQSLDTLPDNVILCDRVDNIHSILDAVDGVICYNSGVGLLGACHGTSLITIGNAFYNFDGIGTFADSLAEAAKCFSTGVPKADQNAVERLIAKYIFHRYSWFTADDDIREFKDRKAHGYKNIRVARSVLDGRAITHLWEHAVRPVADRSYAVAIANFQPNQPAALAQAQKDVKQAPPKPPTPQPTVKQPAPKPAPAAPAAPKPAPAAPAAPKPAPAAPAAPKANPAQIPPKPMQAKQNLPAVIDQKLIARPPTVRTKIAKLIVDPRRFFEDAKNPIFRPIRHLFR